MYLAQSEDCSYAGRLWRCRTDVLSTIDFVEYRDWSIGAVYDSGIGVVRDRTKFRNKVTVVVQDRY